MNELVEIKQESVMEVFTTPHGLDPYLEKIKAEVDNFTKTVVDINEKKNREKIKSMAFKVTRSKTYLDGLGKDLVTDLKKKPKLIDAERKRARELIEEWAAEVRKPLTDFEEAQRVRVEQITASIDHLRGLANLTIEHSADVIGHNLDEASDFFIDESFDEYLDTAVSAKHETVVALKDLLAKRVQHDKDQEELALLRQQKAEQEAKEAKEKLEREAKEKALLDAKKELDEERARIEEEAQKKIDAANERADKAEEKAKPVYDTVSSPSIESSPQDNKPIETVEHVNQDNELERKKAKARSSIIGSLDFYFPDCYVVGCADAIINGEFDHIQVVL